uniref:Stromal cell derived factor 4 n=1 Tax=Rousettus aegyptiacus TaxID=9407 RepID=A0A7J8KG48_ROUAE|nr:stromal cell derived factor 4 [Rousettus aegyptiacus]
MRLPGRRTTHLPGVDVDTDRKVSAKELQRWIMAKTAEHFQEAVQESRAHFRAVDPDGDGRVSWDEYKVKFLASKGHDEREVAEKIKRHAELKVDEETQEVLENLKDRWYQADNPPSDLLLTEDEFLSFLHPEHSRGMLKYSEFFTGSKLMDYARNVHEEF